MIVDARRPVGRLPDDFDVCVVGSGPAGLAVASELARRISERNDTDNNACALRIGVVEGGGTHATLRAQRLLVDARSQVNSGSDYWNLAAVRTRMLGGSGNRWGGISRPLDPLDLAPRDWAPGSGWPIGYSDLARHLQRAGELLALPAEECDRDRGDEPRSADFDIARYRLSPRTRLGAEIDLAQREDRSLTILTNLNVTELALDPTGQRIQSIVGRAFGGPERRITARTFVLAAGGIENARLLLVSPGPRGSAAGIGNEHDVVGRYFMEHVHAPVAVLEPGGPLDGWSSYLDSGWPRLTRSLVVKPETQIERRMLSASLAIGPLGYVGAPPYATRDYRLGLVLERTMSRLAEHGIVPRLPRLSRRGGEPTTQRLVVYRGEQPARRENRVVLGDDRDEFGRRRARLDWSLGAPELDNVGAVLDLFRATVEKQGWGRLGPMLPDWQSKIIGGPHHLGATRMSDSPCTGVVDRDCKVFGVDNLYLAGSSVFASGGHANPTLTLVALAVRLAEHLADRLPAQTG